MRTSLLILTIIFSVVCFSGCESKEEKLEKLQAQLIDNGKKGPLPPLVTRD
ncbi:MAG: hypothetical protein WBE18_07095 [Gammaproteobacteria bacterium]